MSGPVLEYHVDRAAWLAARRTGIGSSDAPAILGLSPWKSPFQVWAEKLGLGEPDAAESEAMEWGLRLQPVIAQKYAQETGRRLGLAPGYVIARDPERPWLFASPDDFVEDGTRGQGVLEVKTASAYRADDWLDEAPLLYQVQLQHQLLVTRLGWGSLAVLIGGQRFRWADFEASAVFHAVLLERLEAFWVQHVLAQESPTVDGTVATREILARLYPTAEPGRVVELPPEAVDWDRQYREAQDAIRAAEGQKREAENRLRAAIGDAEAGVLTGGVVWTHKLVEKAAYSVAATSYRQLRRSEKRRA